MPVVKNDDATGLRVDVAIENPRSGETKWVDITVVHTSAESYQKKELEVAASKQISKNLAANPLVPDVAKRTPSPTLLKRADAKVEKYSRLLYIANKQFGERKRRCAPSFVPFALSDYGELSPQATELLEWLVSQFKFNWLSQGPRPDGSKLADSVRCFRRKLREPAIGRGCRDGRNAASCRPALG